MMPSTRDRLRKSKSARSFRKSRPSTPPDPFDLELAKYHATTAASRAMLRSSERSSAESKSSYDRLGGPGSMAVPQRRHPSNSIQFPDKSPSINRASVVDSPATHRLEIPVSPDHYQSPLAELPPITEFGGLDGRNSSQPSSYRRLRKAKSMFSTRNRPSHVPHGMSPRDEDETPLPEMSLRSSMSFLRGSHPSKTIRHAKSQDVSVLLARAQFLQNADDQYQGRQPSLPTHRPRREHKPFRKTFRTTSAPGLDASGVPSWTDQSRTAAFHGRARTISQTIKKGFKRVFGLSKHAEETVPIPMPPISPSQNGCENSFTEAGPDYTPDSNDPDRRFDQPSRPQTVIRNRSSESLATSNSRVTSWADSSIANTIAIRRAADGHSLSIIDEYDDINQMPQHTPTSFRHALSSHASSVDMKSNAMKQGKPIDSQRLYSALIKRIARGNIPADEGVAFGAVKEHCLIPERTSSAYSRRSRQTVRHIDSNESVISPRSFFTANGDAFTPTRRSQRRSRQLPTIGSGQYYGNDQPGGSAQRKEADPHDTGHVLDGDSGCVIVAKQGNMDYEPYSPSVYSRSTNTPGKKDKFDSEEPGTVTILSSQRTAYNSPKRTTVSPGVPIHPSSDWQQWMSSEMERIENLPPTRDHVRENAQILDDDSPSLHPFKIAEIQDTYPSGQAGTARESEAWITGRVSSSSNFSRPFSRSSSIRSIVPKTSANIAAESSTSVFPTPDQASDPGNQGFYISNPFESKIALSPMHPRPNKFCFPDSPTPKRDPGEVPRAANEQYRRYSSRRMPVSMDGKGQRPMRGYRDQRKTTNENIRNEERGEMADQYHKLHDIHSTISSKRMVEMFLDSRRRQTEGATEPGATGAFL